MKQEAYNTRQRATELLQQTVSIWRQGDHIDQLEGLENDPVFSMLIMAMAYQANEMDGEIERLRQDVLDEYARLLLPYEAGHAVPAVVVAEAKMKSGVPEIWLTQNHTFTLADSSHSFMSLLRSRVVNVKTGSVVRLDGRRWKMMLNFQEPVNDLEGITFAIRDTRFKDLKVSVDGRPLSLIKPWNYADMPLQPCFEMGALLYNHAQMYSAAMTGLELYARQNLAIFYIAKEEKQPLFPMGTERVELVLEFSGIADDFVFDKTMLVFNALILTNVQQNTVTLTADRPMARIAGYKDTKGNGQQLMYLLPPAQEQLFGKTPVIVRRVAADRFNHAALTRLVNSLATKFNTDYYAFLTTDNADIRNLIGGIQDALERLKTATQNDAQSDISGIYLILDHKTVSSNSGISLDINYLITAGANVNEYLQEESVFSTPAGIDSVNILAKPVPGFNEINNAGHTQELVRYHLVTNDRIVTPADMKLFCYAELMNRYAIIPDMIESITVNRLQRWDIADCGNIICVTVTLADNPFVRRSFEDKIPQAEMLLQTLMEVRSNQLYPIYVYIKLKQE